MRWSAPGVVDAAAAAEGLLAPGEEASLAAYAARGRRRPRRRCPRTPPCLDRTRGSRSSPSPSRCARHGRPGPPASAPRPLRGRPARRGQRRRASVRRRRAAPAGAAPGVSDHAGGWRVPERPRRLSSTAGTCSSRPACWPTGTRRPPPRWPARVLIAKCQDDGVTTIRSASSVAPPVDAAPTSRRARELLDGVVAHAPRWSRTGRWPSGSADRSSSSARTCSAPARSRSAAPTPGSPGSPTRSGRAGVVAASAGNHAQGVALAAQLLGIRATVFMPERAPLPKVQATRGVRRRGRARARQTLDDALVAAARVRRADRRGVHPPLRPPRHRRRAGHGRPGDPRAVPGRAHRRRLHRRRRPARRHRRRGEGPASRRPGRRRAGRGGRGVTRRRWPPASRCRWRRWRTMADGIAVGRPGERPVRASSQLVDEVRTVTEERSPGPCCSASSGPSWSSSRPARPASPRCWTTRRLRAARRRGALRRQHRPAAADAGAPARHGGRRPLPALRLRVPDRPGSLAALLAELAAAERQRARGRARAHRHPAARRRGRGRRAPRDPRARPLPQTCSPRCARPATRSVSTDAGADDVSAAGARVRHR